MEKINKRFSKAIHPTDRSKLKLPRHKVCAQCGVKKPSSHFWVNAMAPDHLQTKCKPCLLEVRKLGHQEKLAGRIFSDTLRDMLLEDRGEQLFLVLHQLLESAGLGDLKATEMLMNRVEGKPTEHVIHDADPNFTQLLKDANELRALIRSDEPTTFTEDGEVIQEESETVH